MHFTFIGTCICDCIHLCCIEIGHSVVDEIEKSTTKYPLQMNGSAKFETLIERFI